MDNLQLETTIVGDVVAMTITDDLGYLATVTYKAGLLESLHGDMSPISEFVSWLAEGEDEQNKIDCQDDDELPDGPACEGCGYELDERVDVQFEGGFCNECI